MTGRSKDAVQRRLDALVRCHDVSTLDPGGLIQLVEEATELRQFAPSGRWSRDPRTGEAILFNPARSQRPVDYPGGEESGTNEPCPICRGETTDIIDMVPLSRGCTFVNWNLFPMLLPGGPGDGARGIHLLQWTSSIHHHDWPELATEDRRILMDRLAALETALLVAAPVLYRQLVGESGDPFPWHVSIIKNAGRAVGGSLEHGHQQIALTNRIPGGLIDDRGFAEREGRPFSAWLREAAGEALTVKDYGAAVLLVPPFMKRPFDMVLALRDPDTGLLGHATNEQRQALADAWSDAIALMRGVQALRGRDPAYNVVVRSNPRGGLYVEFLPHSQEYGGYERTGLFSCQGDPPQTAGELRDLLVDLTREGSVA